MAEDDRIYSAGDLVPESGIYQVMHYRHRLYHEATLLRGSVFPPCTFCGEKVRFRLVHTANHIEHDRDFKRKGNKSRSAKSSS